MISDKCEHYNIVVYTLGKEMRVEKGNVMYNKTKRTGL